MGEITGWVSHVKQEKETTGWLEVRILVSSADCNAVLIAMAGIKLSLFLGKSYK